RRRRTAWGRGSVPAPRRARTARDTQNRRRRTIRGWRCRSRRARPCRATARGRTARRTRGCAGPARGPRGRTGTCAPDRAGPAARPRRRSSSGKLAQVLPEEVERALTGELRALRVIAPALVAVEAVARGVDVGGHGRLRLLHRLPVVGRDGRVRLA